MIGGNNVKDDTDFDDIPDEADNCPDVANIDQADEDGDGVPDACDACPGFDDSLDTDGDGVRECHGCLNAEEGETMSMEFAIYAEYGESLELAQQYIAEELEAIGFDLELALIEGVIMWAPALALRVPCPTMDTSSRASV